MYRDGLPIKKYCSWMHSRVGETMKFSRFQGDPAILISERGTQIEFQGGQPVMDHGLHNAVLISLYTKPGWWGNALVTEESKKIGSDVERQRTIVDTQTINDVTDDVERALKWMQDTKLVNNIEITVTNPKLDYILIDISTRARRSRVTGFKTRYKLDSTSNQSRT
jgi:phage gp46-like protein